MVLILAVEPDARQLANIATVLRARPQTELVIAESAVRALQTLADRVPDVLLTSPLLSRQDETALAAWLTHLGPAAAHVQELTIPILATSAPPPKKRRGVLATLRRERTHAAAPDGCDPDVFAEQVSGYMDRASAGRAPVAPAQIEIAPSDVEEIAPAQFEVAPTPIEAAPDVNVELLLLPVGPLPEASAPVAEPERVLAADTEDLLPLVCAVAFTPETTLELLLLPDWLPEGRPEGPPLRPQWYEGSPCYHEVLRPDTEDLLPLVCAYEPQAPPADSLAVAQQVVAEDAELWVPIFIDEESEDTPPVVPDDVWVLGPVTGIDDLLEICVPESASVAAPPPPPSRRGGPSGPPAAAKKAAKTKTRSKPKPVQDEWGFFDPDQCGFAALLAKLDDITEEHDAQEDAQHADTTVRLLSY